MSTYTTYVTTWGPNPSDLIHTMADKGLLTPSTRIVLAFASFNFDSSLYIPGINGGLTIADIIKINNFVHSAGAKISLSVGGATYPFAGSDLYGRPGDLANNINNVLLACGFDGVDFDIEDNAQNVPADFVNQAGSLINTLRSLNTSLYITLTTAAQAWATGCYQQNLINITIGNLDAWQPMEYDLWIQDGSTYAQQIESDIEFYLNTWKVAPNKMVLGLMPGLDDTQHTLSLTDALAVTEFAKSAGLKGIMTWDADIDSAGADGNAPFAYSQGIVNALSAECKFRPIQSDVPKGYTKQGRWNGSPVEEEAAAVVQPEREPEQGVLSYIWSFFQSLASAIYVPS
jgi:Glycosyl hydrolases family 18